MNNNLSARAPEIETNADRIRADIESLAAFGVAMYLQGCCDGNEERTPDITVKSMRKYLQQPAPEEGEQHV